MKTFTLVVVGNYLLRALVGASLAAPFARVVGASGVSQFPAGDRLLFEPSGLYLLELLRLAGPELVALGEGSLRFLVGAGLLSLAARALTFSALGTAPFELGAAVARAVRLLPGFLLITGFTLLAQVLCLGLCLWLGSALSELLERRSEPSGDLGFLALGLVGLSLWLLLGALAELARASLAHLPSTAFDAIGRAFELARRSPARLFSRWAGFGATGIALAALVAVLCGLVDVSRPGEWRVLLVFVLHQLAVLGICALHTAWLRAALRAAQEPIASR